MSPGRRRLRWLAAALAGMLVAGVWISRQFPALTNGPKSSAEIVASLFQAPIDVPAAAAQYAMGRVKKDAVLAFIQVLDAPADVKMRASALVRDDRFDTVIVPFVFYLYDLYAGPASAGPGATDDLGYAESPAPAAAASPAVVTTAIRHPLVVRRHAGNALRLFDALFLNLKPGVTADTPVADRYEPAAYKAIATLVRQLAGEFMNTPDDAQAGAKNEYAVMLEETIRDERKLAVFVEFFTDLVRDLTDRWLRSFVTREKRKEARLAWVESRIAANRYFEIADWARAQAERKLAVHLAVDGLQGKLLEGLVQLSGGEATGSGAKYVADLVRRHQRPMFAPATYGSRQPAPLGHDIVELVDRPASRPDYLENFRKYFFAADAPSVVVNVATVDTPSISVRNLPVIYSGHGVAGPNGTGIPNFSYLDRATERGWYFWGSDILHMRDIFANREDLIPNGRRREGPGARTLMERLWQRNTISAMATVDNGALTMVSSEVGIGIGELSRNFIEKILLLQFRERARVERDLNERRRWLFEHRSTSDSLLGALVTQPLQLATFRDHARYLAEHEDEGLPDYLLWYNPWPDHFAHGKGPYSDFIVGFTGEYDRLDFYVGKMMEVYASVPVASGQGGTYLDRTLFGVVSDHGLVYTPNLISTDARLFDAMRREGVRISHLKLTHDEGGLPAIHSRRDVKPTRPYDAVVGSTAGGSYIIDLFLTTAKAGAEDAWQQQPDYHDLRALHLQSGQTVDFVDHLKRHLGDTMDFGVVRERGPAPGQGWPLSGASGPQERTRSVVRIVTGDRGDARIYRLEGSDGRTRFRYEILGGDDPLDLAGQVRDFLVPTGGMNAAAVRAEIARAVGAGEALDELTWQGLLSATERPDVIAQLSRLYDSERAGTINVFPSAAVGMNSAVPGRHAGEAFGEKNGTQLYRGAGLRRATIQTARNGSLPVTIYHWLVGDAVFTAAGPAGTPRDQFGYPSLLDEAGFRSIRR